MHKFIPQLKLPKTGTDLLSRIYCIGRILFVAIDESSEAGLGSALKNAVL